MNELIGKLLSFKNRLEKVNRHIGKQARKAGVTCYRLYDHDLPEAPFRIEVYESRLHVSEYKRRHNLTDEEHDAWLEDCRKIMSDVTGIGVENIYFKLRQRKEGRLGQYQKVAATQDGVIVTENGLKFIVNLNDYLDTGLFLDHRITREMVREQSEGKRVLNLFCYTGSFSVYALAGGAKEVLSVDLSNTYLKWTERNVTENFGDEPRHQILQTDAVQYLKSGAAEGFDLIILDPPTFSNSKRMDVVLDVQRDHAVLVNACMNALNPGGQLYFSTNYTQFMLDASSLHADSIRDITKATTPFDFAGKLSRQCFLIGK